MRARSLAPPRQARLVNATLSARSFRAPCHPSFVNLQGSFQFYRVRERLLEPLPLPCMWAGPKMSRISFNRKRAKLKQLLGIRARLALLALILVAPLMLDRARSLEDTRGRQIALASQEFSNLAQHSANAQREVISSVETVLKSTAYIRASAGGIGRSCDIMRASL